MSAISWMRLEHSSFHMVIFSSVNPDRAITNTLRFEPAPSANLMLTTISNKPEAYRLTIDIAILMKIHMAHSYLPGTDGAGHF